MQCYQPDCENEATVHFATNADGQMKKIDLCEECAKEQGVTDPKGFALADLLLGVTEMESDSGELECPMCGFAQADFKKSGRLGCSDCYTTFAEPLEGMLKQMHKGTQHVGKVPKALRQEMDFTKHRQQLEKQLNKAIETEDYEQAALVRDQLQGLDVPSEEPMEPLEPKPKSAKRVKGGGA